MMKVQAAESRLDEKVREANSLVKSLRDLDREANETVTALQGAIAFIARGEVADIIKEEVQTAVEDMNKAMIGAANDKAKQIYAEFNKLYEIMIYVRDRQGRLRPSDVPNLREMISGLALDAVRDVKGDSGPKPSV